MELLHQTASVMKIGKPSMPLDMLFPLLSMFLGYSLLFGALLLDSPARGAAGTGNARPAGFAEVVARMTFAEFLDMGGYARFVWPSYARHRSHRAEHFLGARQLKRARLEARRRIVAHDMNSSSARTSDSTAGNPIEGHSS